jgi:hypothetical protein
MTVVDIGVHRSLAHWRAHPIEFIETVLFDPETGRPFRLLPAERAFLEHAFKFGANGKLIYNDWLYSCPKKSGKTTFESIVELTMTLLFGGAFPRELYPGEFSGTGQRSVLRDLLPHRPR